MKVTPSAALELDEIKRMANIEHIAWIEQGVEVWNQWRRDNPDIKPDLSKADLSLADLSGANLSGANLSEADLSGANLSVANLSEANLSKAKLIGSDLNRAFLIGTNLTETDLSVADLSGAYLGMANLSRADLSVANLSGAELIKTQAFNTKFKEAIFTGACIEDWQINEQTNLGNIVCEYVYFKSDKRERHPQEENRKFAPGEFSELLQKFKANSEEESSIQRKQIKIKKLLTELKQAIENESSLKQKWKNKAFNQLKVLEEARKRLNERSSKEEVENAIIVLRGIVFSLPTTAELVKLSKDSLNAIALLLELEDF